MSGATQHGRSRCRATLLTLFVLPACAATQARWDATAAAGETALLQQDLPRAAHQWAFAAQAAKFATADDRDTQRATTYLAVLADLRGDYDRANVLYARAQAGHAPVLANVFAPIAAGLVTRALNERRAGRYVDAARLYQRAFMVVTLPVIPPGHDGRRILEPFPALVADPLDLPAAEAAYARTITDQIARQSPEHPDLGWTLTAWADLAAAQGRWTDAEARYRRAIEVRTRGMGPGDIETIQSIDALRTFYESVGRTDAAHRMRERAREAHRLQQPSNRTPTVGDLHMWARMLEAQGNSSDAGRYYGRMYEAWRAAPPHVRWHPAMRTLLQDYARFLRQTDRRDTAADVAREAAGMPLTLRPLE